MGNAKKKNTCNYKKFLKVKYKYQFVIQLKTIKYTKDILYYLCFYINVLTLYF